MRGDVFQTVFQMHALIGRQLLGDAHAGSSLSGGTDRPWRETAAAVRADIEQNIFHTITAIGAFKSADHGLVTIIWQRIAAILTNWSDFEHALDFTLIPVLI